MAHASEAGPLPFPVLLADIGGTNGRFALLEDRQAKVTVFPFVHTKDYPSPVEAARAVLKAAGAPAPRSAVLDLAGPLDNERIVLTNAAWEFEPRRLVADLGLEDLVLVNDFEALALALPVLAGDDIVHIGGGAPHPSAPSRRRPGHGLGQSGLIHSGQHWCRSRARRGTRISGRSPTRISPSGEAREEPRPHHPGNGDLRPRPVAPLSCRRRGQRRDADRRHPRRT